MPFPFCAALLSQGKQRKGRQMANDPLFIIAMIGCLVVAGILIWGIGTFSVGSDDNGKKSNKIMQYRIIAQFVAVVLIVGYVWLRQRGGN